MVCSPWSNVKEFRIFYLQQFTFIIYQFYVGVDLRPQESEGLKGVYGLKFFYQAEDEKSFFTQWYPNGNNVIVLLASSNANR